MVVRWLGGVRASLLPETHTKSYVLQTCQFVPGGANLDFTTAHPEPTGTCNFVGRTRNGGHPARILPAIPNLPPKTPACKAP